MLKNKQNKNGGAVIIAAREDVRRKTMQTPRSRKKEGEEMPQAPQPRFLRSLW